MEPDDLTSYLAGQLSPEEERELEGRLYRGELDGSGIEWVAAVTLALRHGRERGTNGETLLRSEVERLRGEGFKIRERELVPGAVTEVDLAPGFDLLVTRWRADLTGVQRLDAEASLPDGRIVKRYEGARFSAADGGIFLCCERELA